VAAGGYLNLFVALGDYWWFQKSFVGFQRLPDHSGGFRRFTELPSFEVSFLLQEEG
jgi:hypothetical protein